MKFKLNTPIPPLRNPNILFSLAALLVLIYMIIGSLSAGNSGDEHFNHDHAGYVYEYIKTMGQDSSYLNPNYPLQKYYGQSLDNVSYIINNELGIEDYYKSRHVLNAISGWILILFTGLTAALLFGWEAGFLALLLMFFSPKILGHSWNNPKDIPFAATYTFSIYYLLSFIKFLPKINYWKLAAVALGIAASISIRIGGLIIIPYLFMFTGLYYFTSKNFYTKNGLTSALRVVGLLAAVSFAGYFSGLLLWPYGLEDPINHPLEALKEMTNYDVGLNQLFNGEITMSKNLPWTYGIEYILITSPVAVWAGLLIFTVTLAWYKFKRLDYLFYFFLIFAFVFPIAYTIYKNSNLYGGWRHLLWTYSPLVVLAAGGFDYFLKKDNKYIKYGTIVLIAILLFHPVRHTFKNHPHQYVYYNQLVGGIKGAYGTFEMDYYYHSLRDGAEWLIENELGNDTIIVATNHSRISEYYFRNHPQVKVEYCRYYEKSKNEWDYAIWANTHITPKQLHEGYWPPKHTIHTMDVDGVPIGAVVRRISGEDLKGFNAYKKNQLNEAKKHFKNFLKVYPECEQVLEGYANIMLRERKPDSTLVYADSSLYYNPRQLGAWMLKASAYNTQKKYKDALEASNEMLKIKEEFAEAHYQKGFALKNLNKPNDALKEFQKATGYKKEYYQAMMQMGDILMNYKQYQKALNIFDLIFKYKPDDFYAKTRSAKCHHLLKSNPKAEELLKSLPQRNQNHLEVVMVKCRVAMSKNDMTGAGRYLQMARNINNNADLFVVRAMYVEKQNKADTAIQYLGKAIELDPLNREAQDMLKLLEERSKSTPAQQKQTQQKQVQNQSIMFQKPKPKQTSPFKIPKK